MVGLLLLCFTPFLTDPTWRVYVGYFILVQMIIITGANLILTWHAIMWQVFWRMEQEEKVYEAIIQRSQTQIQRQKTKEIEQAKATQLHSINELSSGSEESESEHDRSKVAPVNDLEQLVNIGPVGSADSESEDSPSPTHKTKSQASELEISEASSESARQEVFDNYLSNWGKQLNEQMNENDMKQSAYTEAEGKPTNPP